MLGPVRIRSDAFGCSRMHLSAFGCVRKLPEIFGFFRVFGTTLLILDAWNKDSSRIRDGGLKPYSEFAY